MFQIKGWVDLFILIIIIYYIYVKGLTSWLIG